MSNTIRALVSPIILALLLSACSALEQAPGPLAEAPPDARESDEPAGSGADASAATQNPSDPDEELVVENLVSEANSLEDTQSSLDPVPERIVPVTPTVTMTANRVVERAINDHLQNRRTLLRIWIERGQTYFPMVEKIFAEEGVPDELKYIALGESNLQPRARSWAGAAGMWQFMPATARGAGLKVNDWVDERLDPEKSTRAAARHLKELYNSYSGNWHLVLAGYNCSYRCISRAVRRAGGTIDDPPSFWEIYPYLPRETRGFVPKFIAASLIVSNPEMYGIEQADSGQEYRYDIVDIQGMLRLEDAATLAGVDVATIRNLNPALLKNSLPDSEQSYPLKIPPGTWSRFVTAFNRLPEEARVTPSEYTVRSGDTLGRIARNFETSVSELQAANNIRGHLIHPGDTILIPGAGVPREMRITSEQRRVVDYGEARYRPIKLGEEFQLVEQSGSSPEAPLLAVSLSDDFVDELMVPTIYQVRPGDTLGQIAERFDVSVRDIRVWNNISGNLIRVNQELTLHTGATEPTRQTYRVQRGDNLATIARRFGVTVDNLKRWNGLNGDTIFPGQDLQLN